MVAVIMPHELCSAVHNNKSPEYSYRKPMYGSASMRAQSKVEAQTAGATVHLPNQVLLTAGEDPFEHSERILA